MPPKTSFLSFFPLQVITFRASLYKATTKTILWILIPAACETDLAGAVSMYALSLASGQAPALLDWNNNFADDRNKCVCVYPLR